MTATDPVLRATSAVGVSLAEIGALTADALARSPARERRFMVVVPDSTRRLPVVELFGAICDALRGRAARVDAIIAQGTHPPMSAGAKRRWVFGERRYPSTEIFDHEWEDDTCLAVIGTVPLDEQIRRFGEEHRAHAPLLGFARDMSIRVNRRLLEYDRVILLTRVQPHEVSGFAGGAKQLIPGVSGPEMINLLHAIGSLRGNRAMHGALPNPARELIDDMTVNLPVPLTTIGMVIDDTDDSVKGYYVQPDGWRECTAEAAQLSAAVNIRYVSRRVRRLVAVLPRHPDGSWVYPELWTGTKGMLKTEDAVADGGELVVWAPNIREVSEAHGEAMRRIGYHTWAYYFADPARLRETTPLALNGTVLLKGEGRVENGVETPRIDVRIATAIPAAECRAMNIGYEDPDEVAREIEQSPPDTIDGDRLVVHDAGGVLWRYRPPS